MTPHKNWPSLTRDVIAILRGVTPDDAVPIGLSLAEAGFEVIEVPLNSPDAFSSVEKLARALPKLWIGAGTVLRQQDVDRLHDVGGRLMICPNTDPAVLLRAHDHGMITLPGVFSPTEALHAVALRASVLKFFPAHILGAKGIAAIKAILPENCAIAAVGGIDEGSFAEFMRQGVSIFGLGSSLYKPGLSVERVAKRAGLAISAYDAARISLIG